MARSGEVVEHLVSSNGLFVADVRGRHSGRTCLQQVRSSHPQSNPRNLGKWLNIGRSFDTTGAARREPVHQVVGATVLADHIPIAAGGTCEILGEIADAGGRTNARGEYHLELRELGEGDYCLRIAVVPPQGSGLLSVSGIEAPNVTFRKDKRSATTITLNVTLQSR